MLLQTLALNKGPSLRHRTRCSSRSELQVTIQPSCLTIFVRIIFVRIMSIPQQILNIFDGTVASFNKNPNVFYLGFVLIFIVFILIKKNVATTSKSISKKRLTSKAGAAVVDTSSALAAAAAQLGVSVVEVTKNSATGIHAALCAKGRLKQLTNNRLSQAFVNDFLSCLAGTYLKGSSKLGRKIPSDDEYDPKNEGANFAWSGLRIFVVTTKANEIKGMCVLHDAYLSSYPGPDASHHKYDPVLKLSGDDKNIADEIEKSWTDVPIVCGQGYGRLCLATALNASKKERPNFLVNIAGGRSNRKMAYLLDDFGFSQLRMEHPKTKREWEDEDGVPLFLMYRDKRLDGAEAGRLLLEGKRKKAKSKSPKKSRAVSKRRK